MIQELVSPGGHKVYYGENAQDNELLTFRLSCRNDLWFHARDVPGSHVLLRPVGVKPKAVHRRDMQFAADVAARRSKAKNKGTVPVSYCPITKVSKPVRGAPLGTVEIEGDRTLMGVGHTVVVPWEPEPQKN